MESWLLQTDIMLFRLINGTAGGALDPIMLVLSSRTLWFFIGAALLITVFYRRSKHLLLGCAFVLLTLGLADFFTYTFLKPGFDRDRPCYQLEDVKLVQSRCGSQFGFPSNHAANGMAAAVAAGLFFGFRKTWWLFPVAILVGYTRIYLGVHFPFDVLFGFFVGAIYALACWLLWRPFQASLERIAGRLSFLT